MQVEKVESDVLCVGGGIAGLMAAIRAAELGVKVVVAEKANTLRSGSGGAGNDHFQCYIPEPNVHPDLRAFWEDLYLGQQAPLLRALGTDYVRYWFDHSYDIVKLWEQWGIPMKYEGRYEFAGHSFPGHTLNHLKYSGENQKPVLTRKALNNGVKIINRVMVYDLLKNKNGDIIGAIGCSTREDKLVLFEAKSVVLGTGACKRLYPPPVNGMDFNTSTHPQCTGDGRGMALRAGAELANPEVASRHAGPKYFVRAGQATWVGVLRDRYGKAVGPFVDKPDKIYGDMTIEVNKAIFNEYARSGRGPIYMDCRGISDEDLDYMVYWLKHEGNIPLLDHLAEEGVDLQKTPVEFMTYELSVSGGINYNHRGETSLKRLYASGDEFGVSISHAAVIGRSAGENAALHATKAAPSDMAASPAEIEDKKGLAEKLRTRQDGIKWQEASLALQQIMNDYTGGVRSASILEAGLAVLRRIKNKAQSQLMAENSHELMRCLEVRNLLDIGEMVFLGALERKETRGLHVRADFPITNPMLDNQRLIVKKINGIPVMEWREIGQIKDKKE